VKINIVDTQSIYRRLLDVATPVEREAIFRDELVAPSAGLIQVFGGGDGLATFRSWGMDPAHFEGEHRARMVRLLDALAAGDAWGKTARALDDALAAFAPYSAHIPLEEVQFGLFIMAPSGLPGHRGYTGFGGVPGYVMVLYSDADAYTLARIQGATVHELHHNILGSVFPFNPMVATLGEYIVMEGLAESFAAELYGPDVTGFYVTDFDESRLEESRCKIGAALDVTGFDTLRSYVFGDSITAHQGRETVGVPDFAGYAIGYRVVQQYLRRTGRSVPEATFVPAREIIADSGFFDSVD